MKYIILILLLATTVNLSAQKNNKKKKQDNTEKAINSDSIYIDLVSKTEDVNMRLFKLYDLASKTDTNTVYLTEIAYIYFETRQFQLCINTVNIILTKDPLHVKSLEMLAGSYQSMGQREKAIITYQKLISVSPSPRSHYNLSTLYFETGNILGCQEYLSKVLSDTTAIQYNIVINFNNSQGQAMQQVVNLAAASYNMFAYLLMQNGKYAEAETFLLGALKINPEFVLAQGNLSALKAKLAEIDLESTPQK